MHFDSPTQKKTTASRRSPAPVRRWDTEPVETYSLELNHAALNNAIHFLILFDKWVEAKYASAHVRTVWVIKFRYVYYIRSYLPSMDVE